MTDVSHEKSKRDIVFATLLGYIFIVIMMTSFSRSSLSLVLIGTCPILIYLLSFYYFLSNDMINEIVFWTTPVVPSIIFFIIWQSGSFQTIAEMDGPPLVVFNIFCSYLLNILAITVHSVQENIVDHKEQQIERHKNIKKKGIRRKTNDNKENHNNNSNVSNQNVYGKTPKHLQKNIHRPQSPPQNNVNVVNNTNVVTRNQYSNQNNHNTANFNHYHNNHSRNYNNQIKIKQDHSLYEGKIRKLENELKKTQKRLEISKDNFNVKLRSIEDKCKGINFVIGRVYSDRKGGSPEIRERLNIGRDLYNTFSEIASDFDEKKAMSLSVVLNQIYKKLLQLEMPEKKIFSLKNTPDLPVERKKDGSMRILDVLKTNDKDPVEDYHIEAKEICQRLINFLDKQKL